MLRAVPFTLRGPLKSRILKWGDETLASRLLQNPSSELPATEGEFTDILNGHAARLRRSAIELLKSDGDQYRVTYEILRPDNQTIWIEERGERLTGDGDAPDNISCLLRDITEQIINQESSETRMRYESRTGLYNAAYFDEILFHMSQVGPIGSLITLEISNSRAILENFGPAAFDYMLEALALRIKGELDPNDYAAYVSEGLFRIYPINKDATAILTLSKKLKFLLSDLPVESPFGQIMPNCRVSIEKPNILKPAHLEQIPGSAKGTVSTFRAPKNIKEVDILIALERNRFCLVYQPIKTAHKRVTAYYEALLRYRDDDGALHSAFPFIQAAEQFALIDQIDMRTLSLAKAALANNPGLKISINISVGSILSARARDKYLTAFAELGRRAKEVIVELTETMAISNLDLANGFATDLKNMGARLAIDDFGAGYTSFQNMMGLEAEIIKIDGAFVRDIAVSPEKQRFVRLLAEMAQVFGLKTVAEMVDSEADARMTERLGVDYLQGFYLGRPETL
ncbi:MAG: EAL domain-containing protein [Hellea sp.]|nr:EAL domain-containing protein [Hellea sp.]